MCLCKYARKLCIIQSLYDIIKSQLVYKYTECIFVVTLFRSLLSLCFICFVACSNSLFSLSYGAQLYKCPIFLECVRLLYRLAETVKSYFLK